MQLSNFKSYIAAQAMGPAHSRDIATATTCRGQISITEWAV